MPWARIEAGTSQGVIVAKLDRLSRLGVSDARSSWSCAIIEEVTVRKGREPLLERVKLTLA
jgi:hypothetical protein